MEYRVTILYSEGCHKNYDGEKFHLDIFVTILYTRWDSIADFLLLEPEKK